MAINTNNTQWGNLQSDDVKNLNDIYRWLKKLELALAGGVSGGGGWTDDGATVRLTAATDNVGVGTVTATHKLTVVGDDALVFKSSGTVDTGITSNIEIGSNLLSQGLKGAILSTTNSDGTYYLFTGDIGVSAGSRFGFFGPTAAYTVGVSPGDSFLNANADGSDIDVVINCADPEGIRIQGKDSGSTNSALTVYDGNASVFGGTSLFTVRNDGVVNVKGSLSVGGNTTASGRIVLLEDLDNGGNSVTIAAPSNVVTSNKTQTLQDLTGTVALLDAANVGDFGTTGIIAASKGTMQEKVTVLSDAGVIQAGIGQIFLITGEDDAASNFYNTLIIENNDDGIQLRAKNTDTSAQARLSLKPTGVNFSGDLVATEKTINSTAGDAATIDAVAGRFRKDTSGTTFTLTNKYITANSVVLLQVITAGLTAGYLVRPSAGAGTCTITFENAGGTASAPNANCDVNFWIVN